MPCPALPTLSSLTYHPNNIWWRLQIMKLPDDVKKKKKGKKEVAEVTHN